MKILFLVPRFPWPLDKGDSLRAFHMIKGLSHKHEIHLLALDRTPVSEDRLGAVIPYLASARTEKLTLGSRWLGAFSSVWSRTPLQVGYFRSPKAFKATEEVIARVRPDVIVCQTVRMAEYVPQPGSALLVLDFMDALSWRAQTRSRYDRGLARWLWKLESERLREFERTVSQRFDTRIIINHKDLERLDPDGRLQLEIVPNGVDTTHFSPADSPPAFDIGFVGGLDYRPNVDAARLLVTNIIPRIEIGRPCKVLLAGRKPTRAVRRLQGPEVTIRTDPPDIRASYSACRVVAVPTRFGSGIQNKLLETLAMGIPCVTTPEAALALAIPSPRVVRTATSLDEFAATIQELLQNPEAASLQAERARGWVASHFQWKDSIARLERLFLGAGERALR